MTEQAAKAKEEEVDPWTNYERLKAQLPESLSAEERELECRRIADELGI